MNEVVIPTEDELLCDTCAIPSSSRFDGFELFSVDR